MGRVFSLVLTRVQRDVMQAFCDHAKDNGESAYPSIGLVAWKCDLSERQARRVVRALVVMKLLVPVAYEKGGRGHATQYRVDLSAGKPKPLYNRRSKSDTQMSPFTNAKSDNSDSKSMTSRKQKADTQMPPQPPIEPAIKPPHIQHGVSPLKPTGRVGSKFSLEEIRCYVKHCMSKGQQIRSVGAYARALYKSGNADDEIEAFLKPEPKRIPTIIEQRAARAAMQVQLTKGEGDE